MSISDRLDETIRKVAEVLTAHPSIPNDRQDLTDREYVCPTCGAVALVYGPNSPDHALHQAEQLAKAGLLAPSPLREEWGYMEPGGEVWSSTVPGEDTRVCRYVTDWEEA